MTPEERMIYMSRFYLAYGSNLSMGQMSARCPTAVPVGVAELEDYRLLFKGSRSGNYLTVEPKPGCSVPLVVWRIGETDEKHLDTYEGCPTFYYKKEVCVRMRSLADDSEQDIEAIIYIMHEDRPLGLPTEYYYSVCREGYNRFGFDPVALDQAVIDSVGARKARRYLEEVARYV